MLDKSDEEFQEIDLDPNAKAQPAKKLTEWANEPKLSDLKSDFEEAQSDHQIHVKEIEAYLKNLNGETNFKVEKNRSKVVPKLIRKQAEWRYAALSEPFLSTEDVFEVDPITFEDKEAAEQNALVLNNQMNTKIDKINFFDEYVRTAVDEGTVIVKVSWNFKESDQEVKKQKFKYIIDPNPAAGQAQQQLAQLKATQPQQFDKLPEELREAHERSVANGIPMRPEKDGFEEVTESVVTNNHPAVEVCDYRLTVIDPTCKGNIKKANFIITQFESSMSELKADNRYKNLDTIFTKGYQESDDEEVVESTFKFKDEPRKKLTVYEYWGYYDIDDTGIVEPIIASWVGDTLVRMEKSPFPDKELPFIKVQYLPVRKEIYGKPDGYLLEDNQNVVGAITRGMIDTMGRSANGQQGIRKDALDVANSRKFERGENYKFNANVDPKQAFHMGTFPEIPNSAMELIQMQNSEAESLTGVKAYSNGISGQALGSTATAVRGALDAASKRELGILRRLADGIVDIGHKFISMNSEFLEEEEIIRITNDEFVPVRRDDLDGSFDLRLSISTAESDNEKASELSFMLQTMGNSLDPGMSHMILADIAKLRKMPTLAKKIEEYQPQPDPLAQERAQLEVELLKAQVFNEQMQAQENQVDVGLKTAKTQTEQAKARNLQSTADQTDLNFLEQKDGTSQNRDLEKQEHKRMGDLDLKAADAFLKEEEEARATKSESL